jgi:hypothetical protein
VRTWLYRIATRVPWFAGRTAVLEFFATRPLRSPGRRVLATRANGCPALASYGLEPDGTYAAHSIQVLETVDGKITHIYAFLDTSLFPVFGLPLSLGPSRSLRTWRSSGPRLVSGVHGRVDILVNSADLMLIGPVVGVRIAG